MMRRRMQIGFHLPLTGWMPAMISPKKISYLFSEKKFPIFLRKKVSISDKNNSGIFSIK
jgi:hypothetical protein